MITLYDHQKKALELTKDRKRQAYYLSCGLGKTIIGAERAIQLGIKILVICQKSKIEDWIKHFFLNYSIRVYDLTKSTDGFLQDNQMCVGVINYDLVFRRPEFLKLTNFTLVLDESALISNKKAKRSDFVLDMKPTNVILLSGTPGKIHKLYTQCRLLGWTITQSEFDKRYCNYHLVDYHLPHLVRELDKENPYKNIDMLHKNLESFGAVFMTTEDAGITLPSQNFIDIDIDKSADYRKFLKDKIITTNDKEMVGDQQFKNYLYKRILCSIYNKDKLNALKDLLDSIDERVIIFYNWNFEFEALKEMCSDKPLSIVNGSEKNLNNYENYDNSITLCQYQASSMGLNLQKARYMIFVSPTDKSDLFEQAKKRIHRIGTEKPVFYYKLQVKDSIETKIYDALLRQEDYNYKLFTEE